MPQHVDQLSPITGSLHNLGGGQAAPQHLLAHRTPTLPSEPRLYLPCSPAVQSLRHEPQGTRVSSRTHAALHDHIHRKD